MIATERHPDDFGLETVAAHAEQQADQSWRLIVADVDDDLDHTTATKVVVDLRRARDHVWWLNNGIGDYPKRGSRTYPFYNTDGSWRIYVDRPAKSGESGDYAVHVDYVGLSGPMDAQALRRFVAVYAKAEHIAWALNTFSNGPVNPALLESHPGHPDSHRAERWAGAIARKSKVALQARNDLMNVATQIVAEAENGDAA